MGLKTSKDLGTIQKGLLSILRLHLSQEYLNDHQVASQEANF